jgi:hypothetical protein
VNLSRRYVTCPQEADRWRSVVSARAHCSLHVAEEDQCRTPLVNSNRCASGCLSVRLVR